jgi:prepilin-type N-terminal cleavage/methylation domain-containing protein
MSSRMILTHTAAGRRQGMTLVEMLIATTITLIIMAAVAEVFGLFGAGVSDSRSVIEMTDQMRSAAYRCGRISRAPPAARS